MLKPRISSFRLISRDHRGSVISGFAAELCLGVFIIIAFAFFLLDATVTSSYRAKLASVTANGSTFAARYGGDNLQGATEAHVSDLVRQMGLPARNLQVRATDTTVNGKPAVRCLVSSTFPLLEGSIFPNTIHLSDISVALVPKNTASTASIIIMGNANTVSLTATGRVVPGP